VSGGFILVSVQRADTTQHARSAARTRSSGTQSESGRARRARRRSPAAPGRCREYLLPQTWACIDNGQDPRGGGHAVNDSSFARDRRGIGHGLQDGNWSFAASVRMSATAIRMDSVLRNEIRLDESRPILTPLPSWTCSHVRCVVHKPGTARRLPCDLRK
jgi:hypothetical protein